ncbi:hypothetical protein CGZ80_11965 [Rhodopirellula sp. MGV]|nr:hypothetical protein CGZ80_11965 [Rhodopirellula sp. MGV]
MRLASTLSVSPQEMADQERRSGEYETTTLHLYQSMIKYGLMLKDAEHSASDDRSAAKQQLSNAFGSWVASLEFFLRVKQWTRRIPEEFLGLYDRVWKVFRPRSHWYALGAAREPWLIEANDGSHHGHVFRIPCHHWWPDEGNLRILTDAKEATPNFVVGYNRVYDELIGLPQVKAQVKLRRLSPIGG